jgi:ribosomal protein S18 acetylase RimI-like enzyme
MNTRKISQAEYSEIAKIHQVAFKDFFLTSLGIDFLKVYYRSCLSAAETIAIGIYSDENILCGFATGTIHSKGFHKKVFYSNWKSFILSILLSVIKNPTSLFRLIKNLNKNYYETDDGEYSELLSIGVLPELKGKGIGAELLKSFEEEAKFRGAKQIALTTDYHSNDAVVTFYKKCGYDIFYDFIAYPNRKMLKMIKSF